MDKHKFGLKFPPLHTMIIDILITEYNVAREERDMYEYEETCLRTFLKNQGQLFDEPVAETLEEAEAFLEDCMAVVLDSLKDVKKYLDGMGADVEGLSLKDLEEESEVFKLPDGKYLIVEG